MLDYKDIITKHYVLGMSGSEIARQVGASKSGVNDFLRIFNKCQSLKYPLPEGITNYGIAELVYGTVSGARIRDISYELPKYEEVHEMLSNRKNMTLTFLWNRYKRRCQSEEKKFYQYRQFCDLYSKWLEDNDESLHIATRIGQKMEVDFAGKAFQLIQALTGEDTKIVVFVAILPYSQYIYAEGLISTKEPQWIEVNNHAIQYFGGVAAIVVCDNCKQAVIANKDWIAPELNKDYAEWAEHNHTVILPAKVKKPKYKSSVENAVGILEKGIFHILEERSYFSLAQFNKDLWFELDKLNRAPFRKKEHNRYYYWEEEKRELMPIPKDLYQYTERRVVRVSSDYHVRFDNAYYSVDKAYLHKQVIIHATTVKVRIYALTGAFLCEWPRAAYRGQWQTNHEHLPSNYNGYTEWNATYFISKAMTIGPSTAEVIKRILASRKLEVQTYRMCLGVLGFARKHSKQALEECCKQALSLNKVTYTFIKTTITATAEGLGTAGQKVRKNEERNRDAYVMSADRADVDKLLSKSQELAEQVRKGVKP